MEVTNDLLGYPGLKIIQDSEMFSFSIDSILLADFATINRKTNKIVELCSGNGAIPLYMSLRTDKPIIGVEIQEKVFDLAVRNASLNNLEKQITFINRNLKDVHKEIGWQQYDLVVINPPFFKYEEHSNINDSEFKTIARHEVMCNLEDCIKEASLLLNNGGYLAMVHRPDRLEDIFILLNKYKLSAKRLRFIYPKLNSKCNHILIEARKTKNTGGLEVLDPLCVHNDDGVWTEEVLNIYNRKGGV